jgi:hypothetical protein
MLDFLLLLYHFGVLQGPIAFSTTIVMNTKKLPELTIPPSPKSLAGNRIKTKHTFPGASKARGDVFSFTQGFSEDWWYYLGRHVGGRVKPGAGSFA